MRGNNHPAGCGCEWCGNVGWNIDSWGGGGSAFAVLPSRFYEQLDAQPEPDTDCPECGKRVYFRQLENGGRVFFDALGPPWPKHPCTDHERDLTRAITESAHQPSAGPNALASIAPAKSGWTPFKFVSQQGRSRGDSPAHHMGWITARARNLSMNRWESWLVVDPLAIRRFDFAYRSEWNAEGQAIVSYLLQVDANSFQEFEAVVWSEQRYADFKAEEIKAAFSLDFDVRGRVWLDQYLRTIDWSRFYGNPSGETILESLHQVVFETREEGWQSDPDHLAWMRKRVDAVLNTHVIIGHHQFLDPIMRLVVAFY